MTSAEQRKSIRQFAEDWKGRGYEKGESQPFWMALLRSQQFKFEADKEISGASPGRDITVLQSTADCCGNCCPSGSQGQERCSLQGNSSAIDARQACHDDSG